MTQTSDTEDLELELEEDASPTIQCSFCNEYIQDEDVDLLSETDETHHGVHVVDALESVTDAHRVCCQTCSDNGVCVVHCSNCNDAEIDNGRHGTSISYVECADASYCERCRDDLFTSCDSCDTTVRRSDIIGVSSDSSCGYESICENCSDNDYFTCEECNETFRNDDYAESGMCQHCYDNRDSDDDDDDVILDDDFLEDTSNRPINSLNLYNRVNDYHTKPHPEFMSGHACRKSKPKHTHIDITSAVVTINKKSKKTKEYIVETLALPKSKEVYLGLELEFDYGEDHDEANMYIDAVKVSPFYKKLYFKRDGSLNHGVEMVSHPFTYASFDFKSFTALMNDFSDLGARTDVDYSCGLHIHMSKSSFTDSNIGLLHLFSAICKYELYLISNRTMRNFSNWTACPTLKPETIAKKYLDILKSSSSHSAIVKRLDSNELYTWVTYSDSRRRAFNETNKTIECRMFNATLDVSRIKAYLEWCSILPKFLSSINVPYLIRHMTNPIVIFEKSLSCMESAKNRTTLRELINVGLNYPCDEDKAYKEEQTNKNSSTYVNIIAALKRLKKVDSYLKYYVALHGIEISIDTDCARSCEIISNTWIDITSAHALNSSVVSSTTSCISYANMPRYTVKNKLISTMLGNIEEVIHHTNKCMPFIKPDWCRFGMNANTRRDYLYPATLRNVYKIFKADVSGNMHVRGTLNIIIDIVKKYLGINDDPFHILGGISPLIEVENNITTTLLNVISNVVRADLDEIRHYKSTIDIVKEYADLVFLTVDTELISDLTFTLIYRGYYHGVDAESLQAMNDYRCADDELNTVVTHSMYEGKTSVVLRKKVTVDRKKFILCLPRNCISTTIRDVIAHNSGRMDTIGGASLYNVLCNLKTKLYNLAEQSMYWSVGVLSKAQGLNQNELFHSIKQAYPEFGVTRNLELYSSEITSIADKLEGSYSISNSDKKPIVKDLLDGISYPNLIS
jgi:hypothetical protein